MRDHKDQGFAKHPSIASDHIKFIYHVSPFENLELHGTRTKEVEGSIEDVTQNLVAKDKQLNTNAQKADEVKTKLSNLESRVAKLEKKYPLVTGLID